MLCCKIQAKERIYVNVDLKIGSTLILKYHQNGTR